MRRTRIEHKSGFSILELLIAVIIIGILAAILIPILANRSAEARVAAAQADIDRLVSAQQQVAVDIGYFVRLFALNDTIGISDGPFQRDAALTGFEIDSLEDYTGGGYFQNTDRLFILTTRDDAGELVPFSTGSLVLDQLQNEDTTDWEGPYIEWQRDLNFYDGLDTEALPDGLPDDPWGNNYLLFTREGLVREPEGIIEGFTVGWPLQGTEIETGFDTRVFDRMTILSVGPNGVPGNGNPATDDGEFGRDDDLFISFGR